MGRAESTLPPPPPSTLDQIEQSESHVFLRRRRRILDRHRNGALPPLLPKRID